MQATAVKAALSSEHSNVAASLAENVKLALVLLILAGGPLLESPVLEDEPGEPS